MIKTIRKIMKKPKDVEEVFPTNIESDLKRMEEELIISPDVCDIEITR